MMKCFRIMSSDGFMGYLVKTEYSDSDGSGGGLDMLSWWKGYFSQRDKKVADLSSATFYISSCPNFSVIFSSISFS